MTDPVAMRRPVSAAALSRIAMPVVVVTAVHDGARSCATATVMYVSLSPVIVAVAMHPGSRTMALVRASGELSVSVLASDQVQTAVAAGRGATGSDKLTELGLQVVPPPRGFAAPGLAGALAILWCRVHELRPTGDHLLVLAGVEAAEPDLERTGSGAGAALPNADGMPLIRYERRYAGLGAPILDEATDRYPV